jgi:hypothetical protein
VRAVRRLWSSRPFGVARIAGWDLPLDGACSLTRGMVVPGWKRPRRIAPSCQGSRRARASRTAKAMMPVFVGRTPLSAYRYLRSVGYVAVAAVAVPVSLRDPGQHAVVLPDQFHRLMERTCPATGQEPSLGRNEKRE